ncbi:MAG: hypothetical protein KDA99_26755, partial [Planctomycetales bacterium]|nr:hypothetical protein [Planctomycetales bacterium]
MSFLPDLRRRGIARQFIPLAFSMSLTLSCSAPSMAGLGDAIGVWQFEDNLDNSIPGGSPLDATTFLTPATFTTASIEGENATVLSMPAFQPEERLVLTNPVGANGGGNFTNDWTIAMDVFFPGPFAAFSSLIQTNTENANDVDVFLRGGNGGIDIGAATVGAGTFTADVWYRLVVSGKGDPANNRQVTTAYANGVKLGTANNGLDGALSFDPIVNLFSDESSETAPTLVNSLAFWGEALLDAEVAALGGPTADGIDVNITVPVLKIKVNRDNGEITFVNDSGIPLQLQGYSITSSSAALNANAWTSVSATADMDSGGSLDTAHRWIAFTAPGGNGDLSEGVQGIADVPDGTQYSLGVGTWTSYPTEDLTFEFIDGAGNVVGGVVEFVGNDGAPFRIGDLNFDGTIDGTDWEVYSAGLGAEFPGRSPAISYSQ